MPEGITIWSSVLQSMLDHARSEDPLECCGLLSGKGSVINDITPSTNQCQSATRFEIPAREIVAFMKSLREGNREFLGMYHSHPRSDPYPSSLDEESFYYREATYWIVSLQRPTPMVRCFRWMETGFREIDFRIIDS